MERDDAVRVVVLTGSGRAFCSGADVTEMAQEGGMRTPEDVGNVLRTEYMPMLTRLRTMPKPVIAAMNGPAVGIGASYALACDIRIAVPVIGMCHVEFDCVFSAHGHDLTTESGRRE